MVAVNSCFFCLKGTISKSKSDRDKLPLKWLNRHLKINSDSEVKYFCKECLEIVKKFNELYGQFEVIKMQLDYCLERIQKKIGEKKKKDKSEDGKLRDMIGAKCGQALSELKPIVKVKKLECGNGPISAFIVKEEVLSPEFWSHEMPMVEQYGEIIGAIAELGEDARSQAPSEMECDDDDKEAMDHESESQAEGYTSVSINHKTDESIFNANYNKKTKSCVKCQKSFIKFSSFKMHFESVHLKLRFTCDICKRGYAKRQALKNHLSKHPVNLQDERQEEPERILDSNRVSLDYRISGRQLRENYINKRCRLCDQFCQSPMYFERHYISIHLKLKFTCHICLAEYTRRDYLKAHLDRCQQEAKEKENDKENSPGGEASVGNFDLWLPPGQLLEGLENYGDAHDPENQDPEFPEDISDAVTPAEEESDKE